jgi:glycerophosphoryl diester phosphodiesterase
VGKCPRLRRSVSACHTDHKTDAGRPRGRDHRLATAIRISDADKTAVRTSLIEDAHRAGLFVHTWTFRNEPSQFLLSSYGEPTQEYLEFFCMGIDRVFADSPDTAVISRILFWHASRASCRPFGR